MSSIRENVQKSFTLLQMHRRGRMIHDIGILLFLLCVFFASVSTVFAPENLLVSEIVMLAATCIGALLAAFGIRYLAVAEAGAQVLIFTVYTLFRHRTQGIIIHWTCYVWIILPLLTVASMLLYQVLNIQNEQMNKMMIQQMDELVLIHPMTGLYNSRALYLDLQRQMAFSDRHDLELSLMCIELRYASELQKILTPDQFSHLTQVLAQSVEDTLRIEDRVYATDDNGSLALILGCSEEGARVVKNRLKDAVAQSRLFESIVNQVLKIDLRIAFLQYDKNTVSNALEFRQKVENELQYDV